MYVIEPKFAIAFEFSLGMASYKFYLGTEEYHFAVEGVLVVVNAINHLIDIFPDGLIVQIFPGRRRGLSAMDSTLFVVQFG